MVSILQSIVAASIAACTLVQCHPLSKFTERQTNVQPAGSAVTVAASGTYMRTTVLSDGSIIAGYEGTDGDETTLVVAQSTNGGDSWSEIGIVDRALPAEREIGNAFPLLLADGKILYAFRNHNKDSAGSYSYYRITVCVSEDGGKTWNFLSHLEERIATVDNNGLWEPYLRIGNDGLIQAYYSSENGGDDQDNLMKTSSDGGETWSSTIYTVSGGDVDARDGMVGVASNGGDGKLICVFESTQYGPMSINYVLSDDDGYTWNSRGHIYTAANSRAAGAPAVVNIGGTLVVDFMTNEISGGVDVDGGQMKVVTSTDGGTSWSSDNPIEISGVGTHWPGMQAIDDQTFLALYSFDGSGLLSRKWEVN